MNQKVKTTNSFKTTQLFWLKLWGGATFPLASFQDTNVFFWRGVSFVLITMNLKKGPLNFLLQINYDEQKLPSPSFDWRYLRK